MNYRTRSLMAVSLVVLLSWAALTPTVSAQRPHRFHADTGVITLGLGQVLRITLSSEAFEDENVIRPRFVWFRYGPTTCNTEGVCRQAVTSQGTTTPLSINQSQAASFDMQGTGGSVRVAVFVAAGDVAGDALIINSTTGEVVSHVIMANTEG